MNQNDQFDISPEELQKTLIGFLGHTYKEVSQFDSRLVSANNTLKTNLKTTYYFFLLF